MAWAAEGRQAGWYPDPAGARGERYWEGSHWADRYRDSPAPAARQRVQPPAPTRIDLGSATRDLQVILATTAALAGTAVATRSVLVWLAQWLAAVGAALLWLRWLSGIYTAAEFGHREVRYDMGWALGCWFVPVVWWFIPYQVHHDLWTAGQRRGGGWPATPQPEWLLPAWWGSWVLLGFVGTRDGTPWIGSLPSLTRAHAVAAQGSSAAQPFPTYLVSSILLALSALLSIWVVGAIGRALCRPPG